MVVVRVSGDTEDCSVLPPGSAPLCALPFSDAWPFGLWLCHHSCCSDCLGRTCSSERAVLGLSILRCKTQVQGNKPMGILLVRVVRSCLRIWTMESTFASVYKAIGRYFVLWSLFSSKERSSPE